MSSRSHRQALQRALRAAQGAVEREVCCRQYTPAPSPRERTAQPDLQTTLHAARQRLLYSVITNQFRAHGLYRLLQYAEKHDAVLLSLRSQLQPTQNDSPSDVMCTAVYRACLRARLGSLEEDDNGYSVHRPGSVDIVEHGIALLNEAGAHWEAWWEPVQSIIRAEHGLNSTHDEHQEAMGPNWQPQDLAAVTTVADEHPRPLFFRTGRARDQVVLLTRKNGVYRLTAQLDREHDAHMQAMLLAADATVVAHGRTLPQGSGYDGLNAGSALQCQLGATTVEYTPHDTVPATGDGMVTQHRGVIDGRNPATAAFFRELLHTYLRAHYGKPLDRFVMAQLPSGQLLPRVTVSYGLRIVEERLQEVDHTLSQGQRYLRATAARMLASGARQCGEVWICPEYRQEVRGVDRILRALRTHGPIIATGTSAAQVQKQLQWQLHDLPLSERLRTFLTEAFEQQQHVWATESQSVPEYHTQRAPMSERGRWTVYGDDVAALVARCAEQEIAVELAPQLPLGWWYPELPNATVQPPGPWTPRLPEYVAGIDRLPVPEDRALLHGITGAATVQDALDRLQRVLHHGGLMSIAARAHADIAVSSMSPSGDVASGIDGGVPCSLNTDIHYGRFCFFLLKPRVLERRDLWFANRDFGAGGHRYDRYTAYARSIGQKRFWHAPSHHARQQHFANGLARKDNECYVRDALSLRDVGCIVVAGRTLQETQSCMEVLTVARAEGRLPAWITVRAAARQEHVARHGLPSTESVVADYSAASCQPL
jgi:hypothetical protein